MLTRRRTAVVALLAALAIGLGACGGSTSGGSTAGGQGSGMQPAQQTVTLRLLTMKQAAYSDQDVQAMAKGFEETHPGVQVDITFVPYESLHDKITADQASGSGVYDVVLIDGMWTGEFARAGFIRDVTDRWTPAMQSGIFESSKDIVRFNGRLYGVPWINDTKFLFYNKQMLAQAGIQQPPKTWEELLADARLLKQKGIVQYPIAWSWAQAEAVICDFGQLMFSEGGHFLDEKNQPAFQTDGGLQALQFMVQTLKDGLSNPHSISYLEDDVRQVFSQGQAAFALNWTYMYALANDPKQSKVAGQVGVVPTPAFSGKPAVGINGGMGLAITKSSAHPDLAWQLIETMSSEPVENKYAALSLPIWKDSYQQQSVIATGPELVQAAESQFARMESRPNVPWYNQMSTELQKDIQSALLMQATPQQALQRAADFTRQLAQQQ
ncbi:MAG: extracellular solute-binding protein [Firmicutes bacterium]|nr:extracellular solute-binding protein [Bacillota bacterium]